MLELAIKLVARATPWGVLALMVVSPVAIGPGPAQAQDLFGYFSTFAPRAAPIAPTLQPADDSPALTMKVRPRRQAARAEPMSFKASPIQMPLKAKDPGEIANPVPQLLADGTLRSGDMVMFPSGLRVFTGIRGTAHALADFEPLARVAKAVPPATRKVVQQLRPGTNIAWSADVVKASGKLALSTKSSANGGTAGRKVR